MNNNDGIGTGEYTFWIVIAWLIGFCLPGIVLMFAVKLIAGVQLTFFQSVVAAFVASLIIRLIVAALKGLRK